MIEITAGTLDEQIIKARQEGNTDVALKLQLQKQQTQQWPIVPVAPLKEKLNGIKKERQIKVRVLKNEIKGLKMQLVAFKKDEMTSR